MSLTRDTSPNKRERTEQSQESQLKSSSLLQRRRRAAPISPLLLSSSNVEKEDTSEETFNPDHIFEAAILAPDSHPSPLPVQILSHTAGQEELSQFLSDIGTSQYSHHLESTLRQYKLLLDNQHTQLASMSISHKASIAAMEDTHRSHIAQITADHEGTVTAILQAHEIQVAELNRIIECLKESIRFKSARFNTYIQQMSAEKFPKKCGCVTKSYEVAMWVEQYRGQSAILLKAQEDLSWTMTQLQTTRDECTRLKHLIFKKASFSSEDTESREDWTPLAFDATQVDI